METNNFRFESHVAQQSRRDKLRINQQNSDASQHFHQDYNTNMESVKYGAISYEPSVFHGSGMINYASGGDPQNCSNWKSIGSQQNCDWIDNYSSNSTGVESNQNPNPIFGSSLYVKPSCYGYQQDVQLANPSNEMSAHLHYNASPFYQNTLQEVVTSATIGGTHGVEMASLAQPTGRGSWVAGQNDSNELLLLPSYGDQSDPVRVNGASNWINRPVFDNSNTQGLSLSLSSVPPTKTHENLRPESGVFIDLQDSKAAKSDYMNPKPSIGTRVLGSTRMEISNFPHPNTGPLGPFTGYATILKSSKYMKPTQQMLIEFCSVNGSKTINTHEMYSEMIKEVRGCGDAVNADESMGGAKGGDSGASSSTFYGSNEISGEVGGQNSSAESYRPEYQQKKAKLLYMQDEVCKRYKQYHQQMQMVVSSFESVAGLSNATPYISQALKAVSRHFRCLKNAISDHLKHIKKCPGEELASRTTGASTSKGDTSTSRVKFMDHTIQKYKSGGGGLGFFEPQQPVWRPQRGLPERAVSVLRAWLFDHFLHPYPTDTDKHMLATQTGLTRNQVSNWFINARVRVWKPMVEEIHTLETKGLAEPNSNTAKTDGIPPSEGGSHPSQDQPSNRLHINPMPNEHVEYSGIGSSPTNIRDEPIAELWNQEKRSRVECQIPGPMDGSFMGFVPYQRGGLEIGGLGAVSLTLGLRQSAESSQQQLQQEHQLRQHFGGQMIHDFVG